ncbi:MAG: YIP1 family protein [Deltaproteobacteria bacterium]
MENIRQRMLRAARLDVNLYEEVEADRTATGQAMAVVVMSAVAAGVGNMAHGGMASLFAATLGALFSWYVWALLTYLIGTKLLPEANTHADLGELLRTIGFASSPGLIRVLGIIPGLGDIVFMAAGVWMLVAMVIAVRQALDYSSTGRAVAVCLVGWVVQALILVSIMSMLGGPVS